MLKKELSKVKVKRTHYQGKFKKQKEQSCNMIEKLKNVMK